MKHLPNPEQIPWDLAFMPRWVVWALERRKDKWTKVPYQPLPTKIPAQVNVPTTWGTFSEALAVARQAPWASGVGIVLGDGLAGVDLDGALEDGVLLPWAEELVARTESYTELSPSGQGVHILLLGEIANRRKGPIEVYSDLRFFTVTGQILLERKRIVRDQAFLDYLSGLFKPAETKPRRPRPAKLEGTESLVARIERSRYRSLWYGRWEEMGYPTQSEADLALAGYLLWLCQGDTRAADALFRASGLYRPKWDERRGDQTYGERTLARAMR